MNKLRVCVAGLCVAAVALSASAAEHPKPRRAIGAAWASGVPGLEVRPLPNYSFDWQRPVEGGDGGAIPVMYCFDPSQPPSQEVMQMVEAAIRGYAGRYNANASWSANPGTPITLTWSFVPDGVQINDNFSNSQSNLFSRMDQLFGAANRAVWIAQFEASFNRYSELSGVRYVRVRSGNNDWDAGAARGAGRRSVRGGIRIAKKPLDGGSSTPPRTGPAPPTPTASSATSSCTSTATGWASRMSAPSSRPNSWSRSTPPPSTDSSRTTSAASTRTTAM